MADEKKESKPEEPKPAPPQPRLDTAPSRKDLNSEDTGPKPKD
jgi:hypothetical protein